MERPHSIVVFERCYLGAWALSVVSTALSWSTWQSNAKVAQATAMLGDWYLPVTTGIGLLIPLLIWYFIARRASAVAKWIMVVLTAFGVVGFIMTGLMGTFTTGVLAAFSIVNLALNLYAAIQLFRPDAKAWFGEPAGAVR